MAGLGGVTGNLATAFDTTFLALVMAIVLLFPTESLRKTEYGLLDRIQAFANESLLRRLSDEQGPIPAEKLPEIVRDSLTGAFREHQKWLEQWQTEVSKLGKVISGDFEAAARRVQESAAQSESSRVEEYRNLAQLLAEAMKSAQQAGAGFADFQKSAASRSQELAGAVADLQGAVAENSRRWREILQQQGDLWNKIAQGSLGGTLNDLTGQIGKLLEKIAAGEPIEAGGSTRLDGLIEPVPLREDFGPVRESPKSNLLTRLLRRR
jgi:hypothetical protein